MSGEFGLSCSTDLCQSCPPLLCTCLFLTSAIKADLLVSTLYPSFHSIIDVTHQTVIKNHRPFHLEWLKYDLDSHSPRVAPTFLQLLSLSFLPKQ